MPEESIKRFVEWNSGVGRNQKWRRFLSPENGG